MNQTPQSDLHPSVEMLNAFAEQALGAQEREQMTAHLAGCGRCREVLFLAQEAALEEESLAAAARPAQNEQEGLSRFGRFFSGWNLAWVGGLAAACVVLAMISIHLLRPVEAPRTARVQPVPALQDIQPKRVEPVSLQPAPLIQQPKRAHPRVVKPSASVVDQSTVFSVDSNASGSVLRGDEVANLPLNGRKVQSFVPQAQTAGLAPAPQQQIVVAQGAAVQQRSADGPSEPTQFLAGQLQSKVAGRAKAANVAAVPPVAAAAPALPPPASVSETVEVSAAAANVDEVSTEAKADATLKVMAKKIQPLLPGDVVAVSSAEVKGHHLAVDAGGHLFLSSDAGVTWQTVAPQWTGRAMSVRVVDAAGFELVNENGAVWSSVDGLIWKSRP